MSAGNCPVPTGYTIYAQQDMFGGDGSCGYVSDIAGSEIGVVRLANKCSSTTAYT
jgi:hypothetical protein